MGWEVLAILGGVAVAWGIAQYFGLIGKGGA
jgi:hypothetical protein